MDKVAVVHENLQQGLTEVLPTLKEKLHVVNNFLGEERIRTFAQADVVETLEVVTVESVTLSDNPKEKARLLQDLADESMKVFINIGRYDYQKGHDRLLQAFETVYEENPNTRLVIVAPHGPLREETLELVSKSTAKEGIYVLGRMSNPYALLRACDAFVMSSRYEGLGLVVYEALAVGTAVVTVNITETVQYLQNEEAIIVENTREGLVKGMYAYLNNEMTVNEFDFESLREKSIEEFERLFIV